jgi:hypothetical protein
LNPRRPPWQNKNGRATPFPAVTECSDFNQFRYEALPERSGRDASSGEESGEGEKPSGEGRKSTVAGWTSEVQLCVHQREAGVGGSSRRDLDLTSCSFDVLHRASAARTSFDSVTRLPREHLLQERPMHLDVEVGTAVLDDDESIVGVGRVADRRTDDATRDSRQFAQPTTRRGSNRRRCRPGSEEGSGSRWGAVRTARRGQLRRSQPRTRLRCTGPRIPRTSHRRLDSGPGTGWDRCSDSPRRRRWNPCTRGRCGRRRTVRPSCRLGRGSPARCRRPVPHPVAWSPRFPRRTTRYRAGRAPRG